MASNYVIEDLLLTEGELGYLMTALSEKSQRLQKEHEESNSEKEMDYTAEAIREKIKRALSVS